MLLSTHSRWWLSLFFFIIWFPKIIHRLLRWCSSALLLICWTLRFIHWSILSLRYNSCCLIDFSIILKIIDSRCIFFWLVCLVTRSWISLRRIDTTWILVQIWLRSRLRLIFYILSWICQKSLIRFLGLCWCSGRLDDALLRRWIQSMWWRHHLLLWSLLNSILWLLRMASRHHLLLWRILLTSRRLRNMLFWLIVVVCRTTTMTHFVWDLATWCHRIVWIVLTRLQWIIYRSKLLLLVYRLLIFVDETLSSRMLLIIIVWSLWLLLIDNIGRRLILCSVALANSAARRRIISLIHCVKRISLILINGINCRLNQICTFILFEGLLR